MARWKGLMVGAFMVIASGLALALRPTTTVPEGAVDLQSMIPKQIGDWKEVPSGLVQIDLTPREGETTTEAPYDQVLMRTYVRSDGAVVMLALAYGRLLRQEVKIHRPELCYISQGFAIRDKTATQIDLGSGGKVPAFRLVTGNDTRTEPVTYWIRIGDRISTNAFQTRIEILREGLHGKVPDGILVRVSQSSPRLRNDSLDYSAQDAFLRDLMATVDGSTRRVLEGRS